MTFHKVLANLVIAFVFKFKSTNPKETMMVIKTLDELRTAIREWADARNILNGSKPLDQSMKLFSEFGEVADAIARNQHAELIDAIGDTFVVTTIMAAQVNVSSTDINIGDKDIYTDDVKREVLRLNSNLVRFTTETTNSMITPSAVAYYAAKVEATLSKIATLKGVKLIDCVSDAYDEIKDRKGIMYRGVFVKESDPAYNSVLAEATASRS